MSGSSPSGFKELAKEASLQPQEQLMPVKSKGSALYIGIPQETTYQENRIALTPSSVQLLVNNGHEVVVETRAGQAAHFSDKEYSEAGATIAYSNKDVYKADIILKVDPPTLEEIDLMKTHQLLISAIQVSSMEEEFIKKLMKKKVTAIAYEYLEDNWSNLPIIRSMSEIAGSTAVLIAAEYLSNTRGGMGKMLGGITGIPPSEIVVLGAGTVGEYATRTALGLGAEVKVFDDSLYKLKRLQNTIGNRVYTSIVHPKILSRALMHADVAVGAMRSVDGRSPCVVTNEMVQNMKSGAVIIDVSIDQGGCFESSEVTNHTNPIFRKYDVIHYCVPNIPSRVSRTASYALSNIFAPILLKIARKGGVQSCLRGYKGLRKGVYIYKGAMVNQHIANRFNLASKDVDLLVGAML